jgi:hypothetical protein
MHENNHGAAHLPERLETWNKIARYLGRDVRTWQRWEKLESLPVHRLRHVKLSSFFAIAGELDEWRRNRET